MRVLPDIMRGKWNGTLDSERHSGGEDSLEVLVLAGCCRIGKEIFPGPADDLNRSLSQHLQAVTIHIDHGVVLVDDVDEVMCCLGKGLVPLLALLTGTDCSLPGGDVDDDSPESGKFLSLQDRSGIDENRKCTAILPDCGVFRVLIRFSFEDLLDVLPYLLMLGWDHIVKSINAPFIFFLCQTECGECKPIGKGHVQVLVHLKDDLG